MKKILTVLTALFLITACADDSSTPNTPNGNTNNGGNINGGGNVTDKINSKPWSNISKYLPKDYPVLVKSYYQETIQEKELPNYISISLQVNIKKVNQQLLEKIVQDTKKYYTTSSNNSFTDMKCIESAGLGKTCFYSATYNIQDTSNSHTLSATYYSNQDEQTLDLIYTIAKPDLQPAE